MGMGNMYFAAFVCPPYLVPHHGVEVHPRALFISSAVFDLLVESRAVESFSVGPFFFSLDYSVYKGDKLECFL